jgi:hypothetical protein
MGAGPVAILATSLGTRRRVIASVDIPSADSWQMSSPESSVMGMSTPRVGGIVVLHWQAALGGGMMPSGSVVGRRKCF